MYVKSCKLKIHSLYLSRLMTPKTLRQTTNKIISTIKKNKIEFDAIAFRGLSGSLVAPIISLDIEKPLIVVRKDASHGDKIEGYVSADKYIIIDDFIDSGKTIRSILKSIDAMCVGIILYDHEVNEPLSNFLPKYYDVPFYVI